MAALVEKKPRPEPQRFAESPRGGPRRPGQISGDQIRTDTRFVARAISARVPLGSSFAPADACVSCNPSVAPNRFDRMTVSRPLLCHFATT